VRQLAARLVGEVDPTGRRAVVLTGSWARGVAHTASDVDLWVVGGTPAEDHRSLEREGRLVSVKYLSVDAARREFRDPARWDGAIPGWTAAVILGDPTGAAGRLQAAARAFRWAAVRRRRDRYVTAQLVEYAEEVAKLLRARATGERETASVQRNLIANRMAALRALLLETFGPSENGLWERTGRMAGGEFRDAQRAALGTDGGRWDSSCEGALRLYAATARAAGGALRGERRRIVESVCRRAGYSIRPRGRPSG